MKKSEVQLGATYLARISNRLVGVKVDSTSKHGGWDGTNLFTGKKVRIKSPAKLREAVGGDTVNPKATKEKTTHEANVEEPTNTAQTVAAEGATAAIVCPNCGGTEVGEEGECKTCHEPDIAQNKLRQPGSPRRKTRVLKEKPDMPKRTSGLDAAAMVLAETGQPMNAKEITETALAKGYWKSPKGKTPHATLYSAMLQGDHRPR